MNRPAPDPEPPRHWLTSTAAFLREFGNPLYHLRKLRQDFSAARHALRVWHLSRLVHDPEQLERGIRGKMFATFVVAGVVSIVALPVGAAVQVATLSAWWGLIATIVVGHFTANAAFQAIWIATNRDLYERWRFGWSRFMALERDLLPMQLAGLRIVLYILVIATPFNVFLAWAVQSWIPGAVRVVPVNILTALVDAALFNSTFVRLMGNLFERHAAVLAASYVQQRRPTG